MEFHFLQTDDGSPSLKLGAEAEPMHNSKGAFSETLFIYGEAVLKTLELGLPPTFLSLGLGLGYCELVTTAILLKQRVNFTNVYGETFEAVDDLNNNFASWLANQKIDENFNSAYNQILDRCAEHFEIDQLTVKSQLSELKKNKQWIFRSALDQNSKFENRFSCIFFDAFSSKTSPQLWNEEFISHFLRTTAGDSAVLSTYACTGSLKRGLIKSAFELNAREGFGGKRQSTFAVRLKENS